jgi:transcriptional regulator with XRE-family HTH domain
LGPNESAPRQSAAGPLKGQDAGAIVRAARLTAGLTLADLGRRCGYSASQVSRYERGIQPLTDIAREHPDGMLASAFADATGTLTADAVRAALASGHPYLRAVGSFSSAVTMRYEALLRDLAEDPAGLHRRFVTAMASGGLVPLEGWLDARHGPGFFARRFRTPAFDAAAGQSGDAAPGREPAQLGIGPAGDQQP